MDEQAYEGHAVGAALAVGVALGVAVGLGLACGLAHGVALLPTPAGPPVGTMPPFPQPLASIASEAHTQNIQRPRRTRSASPTGHEVPAYMSYVA
jgi:hypothetical protein